MEENLWKRKVTAEGNCTFGGRIEAVEDTLFVAL